MFSEKELIQRCISGEQKAQKQLYQRYAPKMWAVCLRFVKSKMEAEDVMQEGFIKVYSSLKQYNGEGSFEGWIRKTIVNTAINHYKKLCYKKNEHDIEDITLGKNIDPGVIDSMTVRELMGVVQGLPEHYRLVFNLYVLEEYTHKEISKELGISENTSKSQLARARGILQKRIKKKFNIERDGIS
ncbi:MAG: sigma-70 family RNA polymerase sigma factor [Bacteroidales bacterium]